ncbi:hypothetical protein DPX16_15024 [Anabarilius grahami]|uniref:Uncharacterized protein n=1 Tax=Anabarilius grahami TaxID=495550 RepID=A0A3N0YXC6_ANAGA|nr:hypothetical protein DPX16_15024 [Anabarilius grahami]
MSEQDKIPIYTKYSTFKIAANGDVTCKSSCHISADCASSADTSGSAFKPPCAASPPERVLTTDDADLCDTETELSLCDEENEEEVFTFSSCPHSARRNQASSNPVEDLTFGLKGLKLVTEGERKDARLEDDFVCSESEEDEMHTEFLHRSAVHSITVPSPPPSIQKHTVLLKFSSEPIKTQASTVRHVSEGPKKHEPMRIAPTRCLSPSTSRQGSRLDQSKAGRALPDGDTSISINRASVREISLNNSGLQQVSVDGRVQPLGSSRCDLSRDEEDEEDELRMLASLKREQEEEGDGDMGSPGLSASQPVDQGQHYQKEMNPLLHSNPREWMDVLSPPIVHPNQQMADEKEDHSKVSTRGSKVHDNSGEEEFLNLIVFWELAFASPSYRESRRSESLEKSTSAPNNQQVIRLHIGVIASVVIVIVAAIAAAVFIIRKYCCLKRLSDEIRDIFTALGSTMVKSLKPRDSWVFTGTYGMKKAIPFEKVGTSCSFKCNCLPLCITVNAILIAFTN